jgi:hypothetical protein
LWRGRLPQLPVRCHDLQRAARAAGVVAPQRWQPVWPAGSGWLPSTADLRQRCVVGRRCFRWQVVSVFACAVKRGLHWAIRRWYVLLRSVALLGAAAGCWVTKCSRFAADVCLGALLYTAFTTLKERVHVRGEGGAACSHTTAWRTQLLGPRDKGDRFGAAAANGCKDSRLWAGARLGALIAAGAADTKQV